MISYDGKRQDWRLISLIYFLIVRQWYQWLPAEFQKGTSQHELPK